MKKSGKVIASLLLSGVLIVGTAGIAYGGSTEIGGRVGGVEVVNGASCNGTQGAGWAYSNGGYNIDVNAAGTAYYYEEGRRVTKTFGGQASQTTYASFGVTCPDEITMVECTLEVSTDSDGCTTKVYAYQ